jgi:N-succinyldiaminopimelate aminotransferase
VPQRLITSKLASFGETIFAEMSALAVRTGAVNLGQGFPDTDGPTEVSDAAIQAIRDGHNQYPPGIGIADLRHAIAEHQQRFYGVTVDPDNEVLVTAGATEALTASLLALCDDGDEVVVFEPWYDSYGAAIAMAGATKKVVTLRPGNNGYEFDEAELRATIGPSTRLFLLNTPHNPTGKVFTDEELSLIAELCVEHDVLVITDEVYEHLAFDGEHRLLATYPGMAERTVTISSGGKTFSFTGWKIGWAIGPAEILQAVRTAKQYLTYVNGAPFQPATAVGLRLGDDYFDGFLADMRMKRDLLSDGLESVGFTVFRPQGTYFVTTDIRNFGTDDGRQFCLDLPERAGVVAVPNVVFYDNRSEGSHLVRFAFCKKVGVLEEAVERLGALR